MDTLVVDDREDDRNLLAALLKGHGHRAILAQHGAEALQILEHEPVDLVVTDALMPVMDGFELCRSIRTRESLRHLPVVFYTSSYTEVEDQALARKVGASRYVGKPVEPSELVSILCEVHRHAAEGGDEAPPAPVLGPETARLYRDRLVRKLEDKMAELEAEVAGRKQAEDELRAVSSRTEALLAAVPDIIMEIDCHKVYTWANAAGFEFFGEDVIGKEAAYYFEGEPDTYEAVQPLFDGVEDLVYVESWPRRQDGEKRLLAWWCRVLKDADGRVTGALATARDITEHRDLEEQLRQASKMESVGQLAGGVAHDFNNLLTGIIGYGQLAQGKVGQDHPAARYLNELRTLADRAAALTRQLLAFSRRQPLQPLVLNLNDLIKGTTKMLRRLIGEDIHLAFLGAPDLGNVRADAGQVQQVLMNLAVNARDAMPKGGKLTIETANVTLDEEYAGRHVAVHPGPHVMLAVTDTGCGMDEATLTRIFEPFFTTKEVGKGTGLGLSTVYGIVRQHEGNIWAYSEVGRGTTFKIHFPRVDLVPQELSSGPQYSHSAGGAEIILIAEDENAVLDIITETLEALGYTVFCAGSPSEAENVFAQHGDQVDLLLTDVVMPERSGRELYERLAAVRPSLKVLYTSGYTDRTVADHGRLDPGTPFLQKPFAPDVLARKVREVLDG